VRSSVGQAPSDWQAPCHKQKSPTRHVAGAASCAQPPVRAVRTCLGKDAREVDIQGIISLEREALKCAQVESAQL